jgi:hypothetical protein
MSILLSFIFRHNNVMSVIYRLPYPPLPVYFKLYYHNCLSGGGDFVTEE